MTVIESLPMEHQNAKLAFGVEFELLLKPKEKFAAELEATYPGWAARFEEAKKLESQAEAGAGIVANANAASGRAELDVLRLQFREQISALLTFQDIRAFTTSRDYQDWSVVDERKLDEMPGYCKSVNTVNCGIFWYTAV